MIRFSRSTSITSSNTQHVSRSGTIQDRVGDNLLELSDNGSDIYIYIYSRPYFNDTVSSLLMSMEDLSPWMCNIST